MDCPQWEECLRDIFQDDKEIIAYIQRLFGYGLLGTTREHIFPVLYGGGRNGKGLLVKVISHILGPLASPIQAELLLDSGRVKNPSGPSPEIMSLKGLRLAFASETDDGRRFSPSKVKWLTGGDMLIGRNPHDKEETRFEPTHLLILLTNSKPSAPATDFAFWERVHLINFGVSFVDREPRAPNERRAVMGLADKLIKEEASGILRWLVMGCLLYQKHGLMPPARVTDATAQYRRSEDFLADWLEERCEIEEGYEARAADLRNDFNQWYVENVSKFPPSGKRFGQLLGARFERLKDSVIKYRGLRIRLHPEAE